ncbi:hypothetical protein DFH01_01560 [Falsiroseomonas bella]|uniref:Uracil-DNA glycosylase n=1 Tax=Falsiroseomonas bella TaxID=2184016 RepID=A0A317FG18_9PROT|nr:hypothetical protein [Falsiroseomonas bella]PWS38024.1 hypothetical protein DFH01_01560 [Falsiroseomonas bella]
MDKDGAGLHLRDYETALAAHVNGVFRANPALRDHRAEHPGLTASLGDPFAPVWFLAAAPNLGARGRPKPPLASPDAQWNTTPGDQVFRAALAEAGFKAGGPGAPGGWRCYVTALIKSVEDSPARREGKLAPLLARAETWAAVLRWQLEAAAPRWLVLKGDLAADLFRHLVDRAAVPLPPHVERIESYTYLAGRRQEGAEAMHPDRLAAYRRSLCTIARRAGMAPG